MLTYKQKQCVAFFTILQNNNADKAIPIARGRTSIRHSRLLIPANIASQSKYFVFKRIVSLTISSTKISGNMILKN